MSAKCLENVILQTFMSANSLNIQIYYERGCYVMAISNPLLSLKTQIYELIVL